MGTPQTTCYTAVCDGCNLELETDYIVHHPSPEEARGHATDCDWLALGDKLYCENCQEGKGVPCADCDNLVEREGDRCLSCQ
jgi:hypothetical protein